MFSVVDVAVVCLLTLNFCNLAESVTLNCSLINSICPGTEFYCECQTFGSLEWTLNQSDPITYFASNCGGSKTSSSAIIQTILCRHVIKNELASLTSSFNVTIMRSTLDVECRNTTTSAMLTIHPPSKFS